MLGARASASRFPACQTGKPGQTFELAQTVWHPTTYCRRTREFSICYCTSGTVLSVDASPNWQRMNERPTVVGVWLSLSLSLSLSVFLVSQFCFLLVPNRVAWKFKGAYAPRCVDSGRDVSFLSLEIVGAGRVLHRCAGGLTSSPTRKPAETTLVIGVILRDRICSLGNEIYFRAFGSYRWNAMLERWEKGFILFVKARNFV